MEGVTEDEVIDVESASSGSANDDSDDEVALPSEIDDNDDKLQDEEPLTEAEIEELISDLLDAETKASDAQEALEEESLAKLESEVRQELEQTLQGEDLETAIADEMTAYEEEWEGVLFDLESEISHLQEQLDGAGFDLASLYKWMERVAPNGCCTEAWKKRNHWVGSQATAEISTSISNAEKYLQTNRPVRRRHGKLLEEGASGFLQKKISPEILEPGKKETGGDWDVFNKIVSDGSGIDTSFGSKTWASVYLASTPQQAALMGLEFPGVNEVEEIDDIDGNSTDPFVAAAVANERELDLSDEQRRHFIKVKEEDDAIIDRKLQIRLKHRRHQKKSKQREKSTLISSMESHVQKKPSSFDPFDTEEETRVEAKIVSDNSKVECLNMEVDKSKDVDASIDVDKEKPTSDGNLSDPLKSSLGDVIEQRGTKRLNDDELDADKKKCRTDTINSDDEILVSSSGSSDSDDSDDSDESNDSEINATISTKRRRKKKIRRILDDAELGEETKKKIAIEKERQERLKSLRVQFSASSIDNSSAGCNGSSSEGASVEILGDALAGYIVNVVREKGEEAVRIPPSVSAKLKAHQIAGIRFMWENIIQSIRKVKSGDKGLGCILAHTMGLGKTFQVIAFLYTAMRSVDLGLKTALIVTPVNVLHNWRMEFMKWAPSELNRLRVYMLEDVPRDRRAQLLAKWRAKGGVFLIGYTAFRNLSFGKHIKDRETAREICHALQDGPDILVCDEAHIIKNTKADVTHALKQVKCQRRIALTGSPLQNNLMEYYCMVDFVREGFLGDSHEFRNRFQNPIENGQHTNSTQTDVKIMNQRSHILYEQLKGFVQRMDMNVVKKDLPPKTVFVITVKLSPLQRKLYKRFLDVHGFTNVRENHETLRKRSFFAGYQALARIWNHPGILQLTKEEKDKDCVRPEDAVENFLVDDISSDDNSDSNVLAGEKLKYTNDLLQRKDGNGFFIKGWWKDILHGKIYKELDQSGKMVLLIDILTMSSDVGDKVLVFSQSIPTLDLIELYLSRLPRRGKRGKLWKKGKDWYRLDGRTESSERQKLVERFNEPLNKRVKCTLISTRAGSLGINLHAANRVVIVDGSWNPTYDLQAIYRAWRYGQKKPVFAYRLLAHGTMEEKIYKRQVTKEGLAARVVDRQQVHRTISKEEMLHLFEFGDDENPETLAELSCEQNNPILAGDSLKHTLPHSNGSNYSDKLMESLLGKHHPRWIANYHLHESLLQENEEEKLSKEEQDMAWEVYRKSLEWEEVQRVPLDDPVPDQTQKPETSKAEELNVLEDSRISMKIRNRFTTRQCTNLAHMLTLRSQRIKLGGSTVCGECGRFIKWEDLKKY